MLTAEKEAEKLALAELAATVTDAGTVTAGLSLFRPIIAPPLGAAALRVTVHISVPAPVRDELVQERALGTAAPFP